MDFLCFLSREGERMEKCLRLFKRCSVPHVCAIFFPLSYLDLQIQKTISLNVSTVELA